jgi:hypothetical protein
MSAPKLSGDWSVHLEPHIVTINKRGLVYEHNTGQDRVQITQGKITRQVGWWNHQLKALLPLSGMVHPDHAAEIQQRILTQLGIDPENWPSPLVVDDPGRNRQEQLEESEEEFE